jgi:murein DD-endopeptidase MepM/ murein hydrolase activator NlpD
MSARSQETVSAETPPALRVADTAFPAFERASFPVGKVPNWGAMRTPAEWNRTYDQMKPEDFVALPSYDLAALTTPMETLIKPLREENYPAITRKLTYSTRYFGAYNLDAGEWTGKHVGIDIKLAKGTPVGAVGGGRVQAVQKSFALGTHVIIEHRLPDGETVFSVYGHLDEAWVSAGDDVDPGQAIGASGNTGNSLSPHLHLQIDRKLPGETGIHTVYMPDEMPSKPEAERRALHPIQFLQAYRSQAVIQR